MSGGELVPGGMVEGEGTVSQIGDQICIVVTKRGANIRRHSNLAATQIPVVMVRTIAIWIFGLLASAIIGSFAGAYFGGTYDVAFLWGALAGMLALSAPDPKRT